MSTNDCSPAFSVLPSPVPWHIWEWLCVFVQTGSLLGQPWYSENCDRHAVESALLRLQKVGNHRPPGPCWKPLLLLGCGRLSRREQPCRGGVGAAAGGGG